MRRPPGDPAGAPLLGLGSCRSSSGAWTTG